MYQTKKGSFNLSWTQARFYLRDPELLSRYEKLGGSWGCQMRFFAEILREKGFEVVSINQNHLNVRCYGWQIWEALSGKPSDPQKVKDEMKRIQLNNYYYHKHHPTPPPHPTTQKRGE